MCVGARLYHSHVFLQCSWPYCCEDSCLALAFAVGFFGACNRSFVEYLLWGPGAITALGLPGYVYLLWEDAVFAPLWILIMHTWFGWMFAVLFAPVVLPASGVVLVLLLGLAFALSLAAPRWLLPLLVLVWGGLAASQSCLGAWFILQLPLCLGLGDLSLFGVVPQRVLSCSRGFSVEFLVL
ncbi:hypothetical protein U1Q18_024513 [Sarracenia purpurea var. burkii]